MCGFRWQRLFRLGLLALLMSVTLIASIIHASPNGPDQSAPCKTLLVSNTEIDPTIVKELSLLYLTLFDDSEQNAVAQDRQRNNAIWKNQIKKTANELGVAQSTLTEGIRVEVNLRIDRYSRDIQQTATTKDRINERQQAAVPKGICKRNEAVVKAIETELKLPCEKITEDHLGQIKKLEIRGINGALDPDDLHGLTVLDTLDFSLNPGMTSLAPGIFDQLVKLEELYLPGLSELSGLPGLTALPSGIFDQLQSLNTLVLGYNYGLTSLPPGIFDRLGSLTRLALNNNPGLTTLPPGIFDKLGSLKQLWLGDNQPALLHSLSKTIEELKKRGVDVEI